MNIGIVGAGRWAAVHADSLRQVGATLAGVACASEASKTRVEQDWKVPATTDLNAFLELDIEAVIVASPNYLHGEHAMAALSAGRHVLVEKPMALDVPTCDRMLAAAQRFQRVLAVGLEMRAFTLFARIKEIVQGGAVGRPLHLKLDLWRRPYRAGASGWKADPAKVGSSILEEPIHYLDLARWYLGEPQRLQASATSRPGRESMCENLDIRLEFESGAHALVTRSIAGYGHIVTAGLVGETGSLRAQWHGSMDLDPSPAVALWLHDGAGSDDPARTVAIPNRTGHAFDVPKQTEAFIRAIRGEQSPPATGEDGRAAVALCLAAERSLTERATVEL